MSKDKKDILKGLRKYFDYYEADRNKKSVPVIETLQYNII